MRSAAWRPALLVFAAGGLVAHAALFAFVCDDAFISFRYARNLVEQGSLVYNLGERVEGYSNFSWTLLMAGVMRCGGDPVAWSERLGILGGIATLLVVARFTARRRGAASPPDALPPLFLAVSPAFAAWCTGGLETSLFTLLVTLGWTQDLRERAVAGAARPWSAAWLALAALTRPEGVLFFALSALHRFAFSRRGERRFDLRRDGPWVVTFLAIYTPYFVWRWAYYGEFLPNTYYAKVGGTSLWGAGLRYLWGWVVANPLLWLGAMAAGLFARRSRREPGAAPVPLASLAVLYICGLALHVVCAGGDFMALSRFFVPLMPLLACVAAGGIEAAVQRLRSAGVHRTALTSLGASLVLLAGFHVFSIDRDALRVHREAGQDSIGLLRTFAGQWSAIGLWLAANAPPGTSLATTAAGAIPYYSRLPTLDMLGLTDAWVARHGVSQPGDVGHTRVAPASYILQRDIDCVIIHPIVTERQPRPQGQDLEFWGENGYAWRTVHVPRMTPPYWSFWQKVR